MSGCERPAKCFWSHQAGISFPKVPLEPPTHVQEQARDAGGPGRGRTQRSRTVMHQTNTISLPSLSQWLLTALPGHAGITHQSSLKRSWLLSTLQANVLEGWVVVMFYWHTIRSQPHRALNSSFTSWPADDSWILTTPIFFIIAPPCKKLDLQTKTSVAAKTSGMGQILLGRHFEFRGGVFWRHSCMGKMTEQNISTRLQGFPQARAQRFWKQV